jgi:hypothetical protein
MMVALFENVYMLSYYLSKVGVMFENLWNRQLLG